MTGKRQVDEYYVRFEKKPNKLISIIFDTLDSLKGAVTVVFIIFMLLFRAVGVEGSSMTPTLVDGDWVAVTSVTPHVNHGDIVVITQPWERDIPIIKRVIGVAGDTIDINFETGEVFINGELQQEDYILEPTLTNYNAAFPLTVPEGRIFVMGDNRNGSLDSRSSKVGLVDERYVLGRAAFRIWPNTKNLKVK